MPFGAPDFSNIRKTILLQRLDDMAELAVRLGSPYVFDRQGEVLWYTTFNEPLSNFFVNKTDVTVRVFLSSAFGYFAPPALRITMPVGPDLEAYIQKFLPFYRFTTYGLSFIMWMNQFDLYAHGAYLIWDENTLYAIGVSVTKADGDFVVGLVGSPVELIRFPAEWFAAVQPHYIKIVADFGQKEIRRVVFDGMVISGRWSIPADPIGGPRKYSYVEIRALGSILNNTDYAFDNIILTANEPL